MDYIFLLAPEEWQTISYYRSFLRKCRKKFWGWFLPVFLIYLGMTLFALVCDFRVSLQIRYVVYTVIFSSLWALLIPYIGKWSYSFFLHRSGIQRSDTLILHVYENKMVLSSASANIIHYYIQANSDVKEKMHEGGKKNNRKMFGAPITDIYEYDTGIYFTAPLQLYPIAYIAKNKCTPECYSSLRFVLCERFGKHYHYLCLQ